MKKLIKVLVCVMLMLSMMNVCTAEHVHAPAEGWDRNVQEHWQVCECGEKLDAQAHVMSDNICEVCGTEIWTWEDGIADANNYDEDGLVSRNSSYDAEGNVLIDYVYVREYDEESGMLNEKTYYMGEEWPEEYALINEAVYRMDEDGWQVYVRQCSYYFGGQMAGLSEFDEYGNVVFEQSWEEDGTPLTEDSYEYVYQVSEEEEVQILQKTQRGKFYEGESYIYVSNEHDDGVLTAFYYADGSLNFEFRNEYEYDENGLKLQKKQYYNGVLSIEEEYVIAEDGFDVWSRLSVSTEYYEDGTTSVCEYDEEEWPVKGTDYDAEGNVIRVYAYDGEGNIIE